MGHRLRRYALTEEISSLEEKLLAVGLATGVGPLASACVSIAFPLFMIVGLIGVAVVVGFIISYWTYLKGKTTSLGVSDLGAVESMIMEV